jgi:hypothetical protein
MELDEDREVEDWGERDLTESSEKFDNDRVLNPSIVEQRSVHFDTTDSRDDDNEAF